MPSSRVWASLWAFFFLGPLYLSSEEPVAPAEGFPRSRPLSSEEALRSFRIVEGFRIALWAAEPLMVDPVAMAFDEDGRAFVVEMRDYPFTLDPDNLTTSPLATRQPSGRIRLLEDSDGDGRADRSLVFAEGLHWPTGIACFRGGVFVAAAPDILYLRDEDGDGAAERRRVVWTGYGRKNVQALLNNLRWSIDNHIYGAGGGNDGSIVPGGDPRSPPVSIRGRDFRFAPAGGPLEVISGGGQFGLSFDAWGERFVSSNSNHIRHVVLTSRYLERNPYLTATEVGADIAEDGPAARVFRTSPPEPWRVARTRARAALPDAALRYAPSELVPAGFFTSASGITIWRGQAFVGDVGGNLVHRKLLFPRGVTFTARRPETERSVEFLTSTDNWFRPVNFAEGPDGALYVLDMYRETIEHPHSIPDSLKKHLDLTSGNDRGRIWRILPRDFGPYPRPKLSRATGEELAGLLEHEGTWWQETAQRLLVERGPAAVPRLKALAVGSPSPLGRARALWTLRGMGKLENEEIGIALGDPHPRVREHAVRLLEGRLLEPRLLEPLLVLASDPDPRVRLGVALALGEFGARRGDRRSVLALAALARRDGADPYLRAAILSSVGEGAAALLGELAGPPEAPLALVRTLCEMIGAANREVAQALEAIQKASPAARARALAGLGEGLRRAGGSLSSRALGPAFEEAALRARDRKLDLEERLLAAELLAHAPFPDAEEPLARLIEAREPPVLQIAAIRSLSAHRDPRAGALLIESWGRSSPEVRRETLEALFSRSERFALLLAAVEEGRIPPWTIEAGRRKALFEHPDAVIREKAHALLGQEPASSGSAAVERYRSALERTGNPTRGKETFRKACATCHRLEDQGHRVGPDLGIGGGRTPEGLLIEILDPNRQLLPGYTSYLAITRDGRALSGIIASETSTGITFRRAEGAEESVLRADLRELKDSGLSLMPEGLEKELGPQDLADLIAYLFALR